MSLSTRDKCQQCEARLLDRRFCNDMQCKRINHRPSLGVIYFAHTGSPDQVHMSSQPERIERLTCFLQACLLQHMCPNFHKLPRRFSPSPGWPWPNRVSQWALVPRPSTGKFDKSFWEGGEKKPHASLHARLRAGKKGGMGTGDTGGELGAALCNSAWDRPVIILEAALLAVLHGVAGALKRPMTGTLK